MRFKRSPWTGEKTAGAKQKCGFSFYLYRGRGLQIRLSRSDDSSLRIVDRGKNISGEWLDEISWERSGRTGMLMNVELSKLSHGGTKQVVFSWLMSSCHACDWGCTLVKRLQNITLSILCEQRADWAPSLEANVQFWKRFSAYLTFLQWQDQQV